ncbi:MAG: DUF2946 family protein [Pseudomonadota bacterium]
MDEIVRQALAKWPNVPHCYGWLALDARGAWRMRDERAQHFKLPGDKLTQPALLAFINRNYGADERGCWYFQNGPQRVYLDLEATPYIARTDPQQGLLVQTGEALGTLGAVYLTEAGEVIVQGAGKVAQLDDRDVAQWLVNVEHGGRPASDEEVLDWIAGTDISLALRSGERLLPLQRLAHADISKHFGFVQLPAP